MNSVSPDKPGMRVNWQFILSCLLFLPTLLILSLNSASAQESDSLIYVPSTEQVFDQFVSGTVYREVVTLLDLPPIHIFDPAARPLRPANFETPDHANGSVQMVSHQEEEQEDDTNEEVTSDEQGSWVSDSMLPLGGMFPMNAHSLNRVWLKRLKSSIDNVNRQVEEIEATNSDIKSSLQRASNWYLDAEESLNRIVKLREEIDAVPSQIEKLRKQMSQSLPDPPNQLDDQVSLEAHQALLLEHRGHEEQLRTQYDAAETRILERTERIASLAAEEQRLKDQLNQALDIVNSQADGDLAARAVVVENEAIVVATKIQLRQITLEHQWLVATEKSVFLHRDSLKRQLDHAQITTRQFSNLIAQRRDEMIRAEAQQARREVMDASAHPLLLKLAEKNAELAEERTLISETNRRNLNEQQELDHQLEVVNSARSKLDEHLSAAGNSKTVGLLLQYERGKLPSTSTSQLRLAEIESSVPELKLKRLMINEEMEQLPKQQLDLEQTAFAEQAAETAMSVEDLRAKASTLLTKKREYLYELNSEYEKYLNGLAKLQQTHKQLLEGTNELRIYIDQHVLWIRSAEPIDSSDFRKSVQALQAIGTSDQWQSMVHFLSTRLNGRWLLISILLLGLLLGIGMRNQLDRRLRLVCRRRSEYRVSPLLRSLLLTVFQSSLLPALVAILGWLLSSPYESATIKGSVSHGLLMIAPQLFVASFIFRFTIRGGLAETQLGWSSHVCDSIRRATGWFACYCLPLFAITYALEFFDDGIWLDSLGRLMFIVSMALLSVASFRMLRGIGKAWRDDPQSARSIWEQTFALWSPLIVLGPVALAFVAALGYMYSAVFLGIRLLMTWWLILGTVSAYYMLKRLIDIGHNIIQSRRRNRRSREPDPIATNAIGRNELNRNRLQVTRLLHVSSVAFFLLFAFTFWYDVVPAFKALDYGLWQVNRPMETIGPDQKTIAVSKLTWITVGDLLRCLMALAVTFVFSRNLPGLLQMVILDRLPLDRGGKYAITIVCRYVVAAVGLVLACRMIGFTWTSVQWLVAAMSVGLGFGLQEIFANFVAGIIILLERPIRVGDLVTVNGTTGFVTRIQLRATMIIDYDRRELIVPNKKFITDDVINWTLSDSITRVVVPVGVAYGSDTSLCQNVLLRVAHRNPIVLADPKPEVVFSRFGESSLDFELRVHIPNREHYPDILHQLHMSIDQEFREHQIEIAFPQQDVRVRQIEMAATPETSSSSMKKAG